MTFAAEKALLKVKKKLDDKSISINGRCELLCFR
jgi:hypothetical protein